MIISSAEAAKILRKMNEDCDALLALEQESRSFNAAVGENVEDVRPAYDYKAVQAQLADLERKIRVLKHAINCFNSTHKVDGFDMTIDEMLVYIPQLTRQKRKLGDMKAQLPRKRIDNCRSQIIDYCYANYDISQVRQDYDAVCEELARAQMALDRANADFSFEVEL